MENKSTWFSLTVTKVNSKAKHHDPSPESEFGVHVIKTFDNIHPKKLLITQLKAAGFN